MDNNKLQKSESGPYEAFEIGDLYKPRNMYALLLELVFKIVGFSYKDKQSSYLGRVD